MASSLKIMGARSQNSTSYLAARHRLVALDSLTLLPVVAEWNYEGETVSAINSAFTDIHPEKKLYARAAGYMGRVPLNPANIDGNLFAAVARKNDGTVTSWGLDSCGGVPPVSTRNHDVISFAGFNQALCALNDEGQVFDWGFETGEGGQLAIPDDIAALRDIMSIRGAKNAMVALRATGEVVAWGSETPAAIVPAEIAALTDIVDIVSSDDAFVARRATGHIVAWGSGEYGGSLSAEIALLTDIVDVQSTFSAFAARRENGQVVAWGNNAQGGHVSAMVAELSDIKDITGSVDTFVARRATGHVIAWGVNAEFSAEIALLDDVVDAQMTDGAVILLRANGQVAAWGNSASGAAVPSTLSDVIALTCSTNSVAALKSDGRVVGWGQYSTEGLLSQLQDISAVYANRDSFFAINAGSELVVWGNKGSGGNMADIPTDLQGNISYYAPVNNLKVMGARSSHVTMKRLVALDNEILVPVEAKWRYADEDSVFTGKYFTDTRWAKRLEVSINNSDPIVLNALNVTCQQLAYSAINNDGKAVGWGYDDSAGFNPTDIRNHHVLEIGPNSYTPCARNADGQLFVWYGKFKCIIPADIATLTDVVKIIGSGETFVALRANGSVVMWGNAAYTVPPITLPHEIAALTDIVEIYASATETYAALRATGQVVAWGSKGSNSSSLPADIAAMTDIVSVSEGGTDCFVALRSNHSIVQWGKTDNNMALPDDIAVLTDIVEVRSWGWLGGCNVAFRATGHIVAWGDPRYGGVLPENIAAFTDIVDVQSSGTQLAALRSDATIVLWGDAENPRRLVVPEGLSDVVALAGTAYAFAALKSDGTVVRWGSDLVNVADITFIESKLSNICAVYGNPYTTGFCILKNDHSVLAWGGLPTSPVSVWDVPAELQGNISYEASDK